MAAQQANITPSMSRRANCWDNAPMENFFGHLKEEVIRHTQLHTVVQAKEVIADYIHFYNFERIQLKTKLAPLFKRCQFTYLQALLGHASLDMVQHYAQMVDDDLLQSHRQYSPIDNLARLK